LLTGSQEKFSVCREYLVEGERVMKITPEILALARKQIASMAGYARRDALSSERRKEIASQAARMRWYEPCGKCNGKKRRKPCAICEGTGLVRKVRKVA
jgi:hypothetical protein